MKPEREKEIRQRIASIKHYSQTSQLMGPYEETPGPDMEEMLSEIDSLREKLKIAHDALAFISIEATNQDQKVAREALSKIRGDVQPAQDKEELKWKPY